MQDRENEYLSFHFFEIDSARKFPPKSPSDISKFDWKNFRTFFYAKKNGIKLFQKP